MANCSGISALHIRHSVPICTELARDHAFLLAISTLPVQLGMLFSEVLVQMGQGTTVS